AAAIQVLRVLGDRAALPVCRKLVASQVKSLTIEALRALAALEPPVAESAAVNLLDSADRDVVKEAVLALGATPTGAKTAAEQFVAKKLPRDLLPQVSEGLRKHVENFPAMQPLLRQVLAGGLLVGLTPEEIKRVEHLVQTRGDPIRGRELYLDDK